MPVFFYPQEHMLVISLQGGMSFRLICTNADITAMVYGFLFNEGLIASVEDVLHLDVFPDCSCANVSLVRKAEMPQAVRGSGLGGFLLDDAPMPAYCFVKNRYSWEYLQQCFKHLERNTVLYRQTGGMHCSALFNKTELIALYEDIGRHNTLDKLSGYCLLNDIDASDYLLITTGRVSQDMVRKAARIGVSVIASYSTPTQQAVQTAVKANITIARFVGKSCTLCTVPERITL